MYNIRRSLLGDEALYIFELIRVFTTICCGIFSLDIISGRDIYVRKTWPILSSLSQASFIHLTFINLFHSIFWFLSSRFIYMGLDIAMEQHSWSHVGFIFFSIVSISLWTVYFLCFSFLILISCGSLISSMLASVIYLCCKVLLLILLSYSPTLDH